MLVKMNSAPDKALIARLRRAAKTGVSASQLHAQRVSFIVSSVSDEKTKVTPEMVEAELKKLTGSPA